ncbi:MAG: 3-hydroxyacyl-CoA dehydrogenase family protein [Oscillospiraceae bacterium]|nr:3-hydroxyacyl-CoA dehydrogenase family protein [Oscillospiraceae bacterium]
MEIRKVCVIGGGLMGRQIALCSAIHGYDVVVYDSFAGVPEKVRAWAEEYLAGRIAKGKMTEAEVAATKARFTVGDDMEAAAGDADLVIEAIVEVYEAKEKLFRQLNDIIRPDAIVATNSSYMVSSLFQNCFGDASRLCNCHFYNPALVMKFVEVVQGPHTAEETGKTVFDFCKSIGKIPILMKKEIAGFAANRITGVVNQEGRYLVQNGYLTPQEVDIACEEGLKYPMGPFRLMDLTGVDLTYDLLKALYEGGAPKPDCYDLIEGMVKEGRLGRKTGHGFYDYV